jgi:MFS family permease
MVVCKQQLTMSSANNGTAYGMPREFDLCIKNGCSNSDLWTFGMLNAMPWLSAGIFGTLLADPLQEYWLGRRGSIMVSCAITIASTIGASTTHNVGQLAAWRAVNGIALGAKASIGKGFPWDQVVHEFVTGSFSFAEVS